MPSLNPWIYLGVFVAFVGVGLGGYFYGHHEGVNSVKATLADDYRDALKKFEGDAAAAAQLATENALRDFQGRLKVLDDLAKSFAKAQGVMNAASSKLISSLKGSTCVFSPAQRQLLECVRRPNSPGCAAAAPGDPPV